MDIFGRNGSGFTQDLTPACWCWTVPNSGGSIPPFHPPGQEMLDKGTDLGKILRGDAATWKVDTPPKKLRAGTQTSPSHPILSHPMLEPIHPEKKGSTTVNFAGFPAIFPLGFGMGFQRWNHDAWMVGLGCSCWWSNKKTFSWLVAP